MPVSRPECEDRSNRSAAEQLMARRKDRNSADCAQGTAATSKPKQSLTITSDSEGVGDACEPIVRLSQDQAIHTPFPPGCPVLVCYEDRFSVHSGEVQSVIVSFEHGAGLPLDYYEVALHGSRGSPIEKCVPGNQLKYALGCPVNVSQEDSDGQIWRQGTVIGSCEIPSTVTNAGGAGNLSSAPKVLYSVEVTKVLENGDRQVDYEHGVNSIRVRFRPTTEAMREIQKDFTDDKQHSDDIVVDEILDQTDVTGRQIEIHAGSPTGTPTHVRDSVSKETSKEVEPNLPSDSLVRSGRSLRPLSLSQIALGAPQFRCVHQMGNRQTHLMTGSGTTAPASALGCADEPGYGNQEVHSETATKHDLFTGGGSASGHTERNVALNDAQNASMNALLANDVDGIGHEGSLVSNSQTSTEAHRWNGMRSSKINDESGNAALDPSSDSKGGCAPTLYTGANAMDLRVNSDGVDLKQEHEELEPAVPSQSKLKIKVEGDDSAGAVLSDANDRSISIIDECKTDSNKAHASHFSPSTDDNVVPTFHKISQKKDDISQQSLTAFPDNANGLSLDTMDTSTSQDNSGSVAGNSSLFRPITKYDAGQSGRNYSVLPSELHRGVARQCSAPAAEPKDSEVGAAKHCSTSEKNLSPQPIHPNEGLDKSSFGGALLDVTSQLTTDFECDPGVATKVSAMESSKNRPEPAYEQVCPSVKRFADVLGPDQSVAKKVKFGYRGHILIPKTTYKQTHIISAVVGPQRRMHAILMTKTGCEVITVMSNRKDYHIVKFIHAFKQGAQDAAITIFDHIVAALSYVTDQKQLRRDILIDEIVPSSCQSRWTVAGSAQTEVCLNENVSQCDAQGKRRDSDSAESTKQLYRGQILVPKYLTQKHLQEIFIGEKQAVHRALMEKTNCREIKLIPNPKSVENYFAIEFSHDSREDAARAASTIFGHLIKSVDISVRKKLKRDVKKRIFSYALPERPPPREQSVISEQQTSVFVPDWLDTHSFEVVTGKGWSSGIQSTLDVNQKETGLFIDITGPDKQHEEKARIFLENLIVRSVKDFQRGRALYEMAASRSCYKAHCQIVHQRSPCNLNTKVWMSLLVLPHDAERRQKYMSALTRNDGIERIQNATSCKIEIHGSNILGHAPLQVDANSSNGCQPYILVMAEECEKVDSGVSIVKQKIHEIRGEL